jgi:hypothetical protein
LLLILHDRVVPGRWAAPNTDARMESLAPLVQELRDAFDQESSLFGEA